LVLCMGTAFWPEPGGQPIFERTYRHMAKTARTARKTGTKRTEAKEEPKEFVVSIRLTSDRKWSRPLRMQEAERIRKESSLTKDVFSHVVDMTVKRMDARIVENAPLEGLRAERVKLVEQLVKRSREVYGDKGKADRWMVRPSPYLHNKAPADLLGSLQGIAEVMTELERIDASAFA